MVKILKAERDNLSVIFTKYNEQEGNESSAPENDAGA